MDTSKKITTIDNYIETFPPDVQVELQLLRQTIQAAAPEATEAISYGMPTFKLHGNLIHFAAAKNHYGLYPTPSVMGAFADELAPYVVSKGSIHLAKDKPIPVDLVTKIVQHRVQETTNKQKNKKKK
jgi:uncharacterized protein YdhG (YjbR/CyaY superfamily)